MTTYFQLPTTTSFADVSTANGIETERFIAACEDVVALFALYGRTFGAATGDLSTNIQKVKTRCEVEKKRFEAEKKDPKKYPVPTPPATTLEAMVAREISETPKGSFATATQGLLWLLRSLSMTYVAIHCLQASKSASIATAFDTALHKTIIPHNEGGWLGPAKRTGIITTFNLAMLGAPTRATFYNKMASPKETTTPSEKDEELVSPELDKWLEALHNILQKMLLVYMGCGDKKKAGIDNEKLIITM